MGILGQLDDSLFDARQGTLFDGNSLPGLGGGFEQGSGAPVSQYHQQRQARERRHAESREKNIALRNAQMRGRQFGTQDPIQIKAMQQQQKNQQNAMHMEYLRRQNMQQQQGGMRRGY